MKKQMCSFVITGQDETAAAPHQKYAFLFLAAVTVSLEDNLRLYKRPIHQKNISKCV